MLMKPFLFLICSLFDIQITTMAQITGLSLANYCTTNSLGVANTINIRHAILV